MGPWRDFLNSKLENGGESLLPGAASARIPGLAETLKSRPLRAILIVVASVVAIFVLFAMTTSDSIKRYVTPSSSSGGSSWKPNWETSSFATDDDDDYLGLKDPKYSLDRDTGLEYPPDLYPSHLNKYKRANATFVALVRNGELDSMRDSMREIEYAFNRKAAYPWVFLNNDDFSEDFKKGVRQMTRSEIYFGKIPQEHWSYPEFIDQAKAADERKKMEEDRVIYGGSESYRHMCRFNSGFFFKHPLMEQFDYYWRVEPGVNFPCDVDFDPFLFMQRNNKTYGFTIAIFEYERTIRSLWPTVREFVKLHPEHVAPDNALHFLVDDISRGMDAPYNLCHFWSNFEIADMRFWRSKAYTDFFNYLDATGNFFYERWGDAPVHSIAAALFLPRSRLHQFDDIGYRHNPYTHCPANKPKYHNSGKCNCDPSKSFDLDGYSCMKHAWRVLPQPVQ